MKELYALWSTFTCDPYEPSETICYGIYDDPDRLVQDFKNNIIKEVIEEKNRKLLTHSPDYLSSCPFSVTEKSQEFDAIVSKFIETPLTINDISAYYKKFCILLTGFADNLYGELDRLPRWYFVVQNFKPQFKDNFCTTKVSINEWINSESILSDYYMR